MFLGIAFSHLHPFPVTGSGKHIRVDLIRVVTNNSMAEAVRRNLPGRGGALQGSLANVPPFRNHGRGYKFAGGTLLSFHVVTSKGDVPRPPLPGDSPGKVRCVPSQNRLGNYTLSQI